MPECGLASSLAIHLEPGLSLAQGSIWLTPAQWLSVLLMVGGMLVLIFAMRQKQAPGAGGGVTVRVPRFRLPRIRFEAPVAETAITGQTPVPPERMASAALPPPPPSPMQEPTLPDPRGLVRDAEELLQLLAEQADQHAARLERLISDADRRIRRLEQLSAAAAPARPRPDEPDPMNRQIYDLADEGLPPVEIARRLEQQTGKVELVLALRRR